MLECYEEIFYKKSVIKDQDLNKYDMKVSIANCLPFIYYWQNSVYMLSNELDANFRFNNTVLYLGLCSLIWIKQTINSNNNG